MLTFDLILSFFAISVLLALAPGPDNLFVLMQSAVWGAGAGMWVVLGLCTGLIGHTAAVAAGLAAVLAAAPTAFVLLKLLGAFYLLYLAWLSWRTPALTPRGTPSRPASLSKSALYRRGIIMNLSNPKVSLFFLAFLPQFTAPERGSIALQTIFLGGVFMLATLLVFGLIAGFAGYIGTRLQHSMHWQTALHRASALVFVGLALRLASSQRLTH